MSFGLRPRRHRIMRRSFDREWFTKADCPGCVALKDEWNRFTPGFCSTECLMRRVRDGDL